MANYKLVITIIFFLALVGAAATASKAVACVETEKQALLSFKQDLDDPSNSLSSWDAEEEKDCCRWDRIVCDDITGHVSELHLGFASLSGKISPSLLDLKQLTFLDLSSNDFKGTGIPSFVGSLVSLRYLDLTDAGSFVGMIPHQLGNLSDLRHLAIASSTTGYLYAENLDWLSSLSSLRHLEMRQVNLSRASSGCLLAINKLSSLVELRFSRCSLHHILSLTSIQVQKNMTHLHSLDLSFNNLEGSTFLSCLTNFPSLKHLALSQTNLQGVIPSSIANLTSLLTLDLSSNSLQGKIPSSLGSLCNLEQLDLSSNIYKEKVSEAFHSLSGCLSHSLNSLSLPYNSFTGEIPDQIGEFKNLSSLSLFYNKLSGPIPSSLGSLSNLEFLDISSNGLKGIVYEDHFSNLTNLKSFDASGNTLSLRVSPDWIPPFHLDSLDLSYWNLGPQFPQWLNSQKNISGLGLSNTGISGVIPSWFWNFSSQLDTVQLSHNQLRGVLPDLHGFNTLFSINMGSNELTGPLPRISYTLSWLDLSNNSLSGEISGLLCNLTGNDNMLNVLRLRHTHLTGKIPSCWEHWPQLSVIDLHSNHLEGEIPSSMGLLHYLSSLNLGNNSLSGEISAALKKCPNLEALNLGRNKFVGMLPRWIGSLSYLRVVILRSNKLNGHIPVEICALVRLQILDVAQNNLFGTIPHCVKNAFAVTPNNEPGGMTYLGNENEEAIENALLVTKGKENQYDNILNLVTTLDLSCNNLSGGIPEELVSLQGLRYLNLSTNNLRGIIPNKIGNMTTLESLDLSWNQLSGKIPSSMSNLFSLNYLNLSYNNLYGEIPKSTQLQSLNSSSFVGNQLLCGDPLPKRCREDNAKRSPNTENEEEDDEGEEYWFRLGVAAGFGVGFLGVVSPVVLCGFWRRAYFWFFEEFIWYNIVDCFIKLKYTMGISKPIHLA